MNRIGLRLIVVLLLATSVFVSISTLWTPETSALTLSIFPTHAPPGYGRANNDSRVQLSGSGWFASGSERKCTLSATGPGTLFDNNPNRTECTISGAGAVSAYFSVFSYAGQGSYTVNVIDAAHGTSKTISFRVDANPDLVLSVSSATRGTMVTITSGSNKFVGGLSSNPDAGVCTITFVPSGLNSSEPSCFIDSSGKLYSTYFTVDSAAPLGGYQINVTGSHGDFGLKGFTVISGPTMSVAPSGTPPGYGTLDGTVVISGAGFSTGSSRNCASGVTSSGGTAFFATSPGKTCTIDTNGVLSGSFAVASGAFPGQYRINVTDPLTGARVTFFPFDVWSIPLVKFNASSATIGHDVGISMDMGTLFSPFDVGPCTITASPASPALMSLWACTIDSNGHLAAPTFFRVATVNPTTYTITVTTKHGETASNVFSPAGGPTVTVSPNVVVPSPSGGIAVFVSVQGSGFNPFSNSCTITVSPGSVASGLTCAIVSGSATGSFQVTNSAPAGTYLVTVTGSQGDVGYGVFDVAVTAVASVTSTIYSPTVTSMISTTTTTSTTWTSSSFSTTTFQTTGRSTEVFSTYTTTTVSAQSTTTTLSSFTSTSTVTVSTLTFFTTLTATITHTLGQAIQSPSTSSSLNILALIGVAVALSPGLLRRHIR